MKKILLIIIMFILLVQSGNAFAQEEPDSQDIKQSVKVDLIKDKVASRVAQLNLVEKRGMVGIVESVTDSEIKISDLNDKTRIIEVDELTKYSSENNNSFDLSDIKKGSTISAIGLYNKDSQHLLARFINETSIPLFLNGVITDKDEKKFTVTLSTEDEKKYIVDVEKITESFSFSDDTLETEGFSKIRTLQNALVIGYPDPKEKNRISASRIIVFPNLPKNPRIEVEDVSKTPTKSTSASPTPEK